MILKLILEFIGGSKKVMYNVLDISRYIINKSIEINKPVNNLKLQKLLYYVQANFLIKENKNLRNEVLKWKNISIKQNNVINMLLEK